MNDGAQPQSRAGACARCETVSHCSRNGCVPITTEAAPPLAPTPREQDMAALIRRLARQLRNTSPRDEANTTLASDALDALRRWGLHGCVMRGAPVPADPRCSAEALHRDAARYAYLRMRPLDTIQRGGVFAGLVPANVVLNGKELDAAVDAAMAEGL